jgi:hypothetical protein
VTHPGSTSQHTAPPPEITFRNNDDHKHHSLPGRQPYNFTRLVPRYLSSGAGEKIEDIIRDSEEIAVWGLDPNGITNLDDVWALNDWRTLWKSTNKKILEMGGASYGDGRTVDSSKKLFVIIASQFLSAQFCRTQCSIVNKEFTCFHLKILS